MQISFGSVELERRLNQDNVLMKIDALIDWGKLRPKLGGLYKREQSNGGGQEPFDAADDVQIDFIRFCGLSLTDAIPDETTLCRFRNRLMIKDKLDDLLYLINEQMRSVDNRGVQRVKRRGDFHNIAV